MNADLPDSLIEDARNGRPIQVLGRRYVLDDGELEHLRRLVAAYRKLHREAWRPVEKRWSEVRHGDITLSDLLVPWIVKRENAEMLVSNGDDWRPVAPRAATVRVLAPIPPNMTDLLLASELGAACDRVDGEA